MELRIAMQRINKEREKKERKRTVCSSGSPHPHSPLPPAEVAENSRRF